MPSQRLYGDNCMAKEQSTDSYSKATIYMFLEYQNPQIDWKMLGNNYAS